MGKWCKGWVMAIVISFQLFSSVTKAAELRDFLMSCAYGTAAGALVGLATLAFSEDPSKNFSNVAKGASLGLYAGIGMGLYMVYGESSTSSSMAGMTIQDGLRQEFGLGQDTLWKSEAVVSSFVAPKVALVPEFRNAQIEGLRLQFQMLQF
jgi:hypothetical protein